MSTQLSRLSTPMALLVAVIVLALIADGVYLVSHLRTTTHVTQSNNEKADAGDEDKETSKHKTKHQDAPQPPTSKKSKQSSSESDDTDD